MRSSDAFTHPANIGFEYQDGFGGAAGDIHQAATIPQALQVEKDDFGSWIIKHILQNILSSDIQHVPHRDELIETDAFIRHQVEHRKSHPTALGNERDLTGLRGFTNSKEGPG